MTIAEQSKDAALADRAARARKIAQAAQRKAERIGAEHLPNRSTAARNALKVKAHGLDQVLDVLRGKDA